MVIIRTTFGEIKLELDTEKAPKTVENFLNYCSLTIQNLKWNNVLCQFDRQKLVFASEDHFINVMKIF